MARSRASDRERGSAPAEFVFVAGLVLFLFLGLVQLGLALHIRNTVLANAAEGARAGARAGATEQDGVRRARELIEAELPDNFASDVSARTLTTDGVPVVEVTVRAPLPLVGPLGPSGGVTVRGRCVKEAP